MAQRQLGLAIMRNILPWKPTGGRFTQGVQIGIDRDAVMKAAKIIRAFASAVDETSVRVHLTP
jgi:hypothetical protein